MQSEPYGKQRGRCPEARERPIAYMSHTPRHDRNIAISSNRGGRAMSLDRTGRRQRFALLAAALATPKLSAVMALVFVSLSIPVLVFVLVYNYNRTSAAIIATLHEQVAKTRLATIESAQNLVQPVTGTLRLLAEIAASDPSLFKTEPSRELLYRALISTDQIDAIYVSFEDGYHRVVTRMDDKRRRSDPSIPPSANWHSSYIDDFSAGKNRSRHRTDSKVRSVTEKVMERRTAVVRFGGLDGDARAQLEALSRAKKPGE